MAGQKGITLVSLMITVVVMIIIAGVTVSTSTNRFKINNVKKMQNDIEMINDKISTYYMKYGGIPILKDAKNNGIEYIYSTIDFETNQNDDDKYYIIDLAAIGNITLNYGQNGYKNRNTSDDVYIINNKTHTVYYVRGVEYADGEIYHSLKLSNTNKEDTIPPTKPQIKTVSGDKIDENNYETNVTLEFVPGKDNWSGVNRTTYSINGSSEQDISNLEKNIYPINEKGTYEITLKTYDNNNMYSEETRTIYVGKIKLLEYLESTGTQYIDTAVTATNKTKMIMDFETTKIKSEDYNALFGADKSYYGYSVIIESGTNEIKFRSYAETLVSTGVIVEPNERHKYSLEYGKLMIDNVIYEGETDYTDELPNITLLRRVTNNSNFAVGKIYNFKIYDEDTLLRDYIPVLDENNIACLYDTVEGKFYYNQGTGRFKTNLDE